MGDAAAEREVASNAPDYAASSEPTASTGDRPQAPAKVNEHLLKLRDGRRLCYAEYGDPNGSPLFLFHGTPGCRLQWSGLAAEAALRHGVRLIAPDRPGFGRSDFQPTRRLLDWPGDVAELADVLGLAEFSVAGVSGGGCHALACAYALPRRARIAGVMSGGAPYESSGIMRPFGARVWQLPPSLLCTGVGTIEMLWPKFSRWLVTRYIASLSEPDAVDGSWRQRAVAQVMEALRGGMRGWIYECCLQARPWGYRTEDIGVSVRLWHGEVDATYPLAMARHNARAIPRCNATFYPDEGHMLSPEHWDEIMSALKL